MTRHRVRFEGPASLAVSTATLVADATGLELVSSDPPQRLDDGDDRVRLALTVQGPMDAVLTALERINADLPPEAAVILGDAGDPL
jgi:hypothetical protein